MTKKTVRSSYMLEFKQEAVCLVQSGQSMAAVARSLGWWSKRFSLVAEVDLASVNYHFGSRTRLYQAVLAEAHRRLIKLENLQRIADSGSASDQKLTALIGMMLHATTGEQSWPAQVLAREILVWHLLQMRERFWIRRSHQNSLSHRPSSAMSLGFRAVRRRYCSAWSV